MTDSKNKLPGKFFQSLRWIIALVLLVFILQSIAWQQLQQILAELHLKWLVVAVGFQLVSSCIGALRWGRMMHFFSFGESLLWYMRVYLVAVLFNQALPTSIGGDALRVYEIAKRGNQKRVAFASVISDRIFGVSGLLCLSLLAIYLVDHAFPQKYVQFVSVVSLLGLCSLVGIAIAGILPIVKDLPLQRVKILQPCWIVSANVRQILLHPYQCGVQLVLSLATHLATVSAFACVGIGVGLTLPISNYAVFVPPLMLFALIPLSLGGWGVRETGAVALLGLIGTNATSALAASVLYGIVLLTTSIPGLVLYLATGGRKKQKNMAESIPVDDR